MRSAMWLVTMAPFLLQSSAMAQPPTQADQQKKQAQQKPGLFGGGPNEALLLKLLGQQGGGGVDPLLLMMLADGKGADMDKIMGLTVMQRMFGRPTATPITIHEGNTLLIIENGTVYKVNVETMKLEGTVQYRAGGAGGNPLAMLLGMAKAAKKAKAGPAPEAAQAGKAAPTKKRPPQAPRDGAAEPKADR